MLNLGDAPYFDEILQDIEHHELQGRAVADASDAGSPKSQDKTVRDCSGYQSLLSLQGMTSEPLALRAPSISSDVVLQEFQFPSSVSPDRIDRPPRNASLLI